MTEALYIEFKEWFLSNGGYLNKVSIGSDGFCSRGLFATEHVDAAEELIRASLSMCLFKLSLDYLSLEDVFASFPHLLDLQDEVLAIILLYLKHHPSDWSLYMQLLPSSVNTPIAWEDGEELVSEALPQSMLRHLVPMMKRQIQQDYDVIYEPLRLMFPDLFGEISLADYAWALSMVWSRTIGCYIRDEYVRVMVPVLDLANHTSSAAAQLDDLVSFNEDTMEISLSTTKALETSDAVCAFYGPHNNAKLCYTYGFVEENNPFKSIDMYPRVQPDSPNGQICLAHPTTAALQTYDFSGTIFPTGVSQSLLMTLRILQMTDTERDICIEMDADGTVASRVFEGHLVSLRNEAAALSALHEMIINKVEQLPLADLEQAGQNVETLKAELASLEEEGDSEEKAAKERAFMLAVIYRDELDVLINCLNLITTELTLLRNAGERYLPLGSPLRAERSEEQEEKA
jgi:hypothetical protein